jgi:hypothetical protein
LQHSKRKLELSATYAKDPDALLVAYNLLADPELDCRTKISLNHFPYQSGTRALVDDSWFVVYVVDGDIVRIASMHRQEDIGRIGDIAQTRDRFT